MIRNFNTYLERAGLSVGKFAIPLYQLQEALPITTYWLSPQAENLGAHRSAGGISEVWVNAKTPQGLADSLRESAQLLGIDLPEQMWPEIATLRIVVHEVMHAVLTLIEARDAVHLPMWLLGSGITSALEGLDNVRVPLHEVEEERFAVTLSFNDRHERLTIPLEAVTAFADPAVKFGLRFERQDDGSSAAAASPSTTHLPEEAQRKPAEAAQPPGEGAKVVALETFRKK